MSPALTPIVLVLRPGDAKGNRMVVRLTTSDGVELHAIGIPQDGPSLTGPTWVYLLQNGGLTLIDAGALGSFDALAEGIGHAGFQLRQVQRVIITHGHPDHDGAAAQLVRVSGAELWAHDLYADLLPYYPWEVQRLPLSPLQQQMYLLSEADGGGIYRNGQPARRERYLEARREALVARRLKAGDSWGSLEFMHTPGHSPDAICIRVNGMVFTGDHILPEVSPRPTTKLQYPDGIRQSLPEEYRHEDGFYGLAAYLRSLKAIDDLGDEVVVLPAHRLFTQNGFNFPGVHRAGEVVIHHAERLAQLLALIRPRPASLEEVTRGLFESRKLKGGNFPRALAEVVAHLELLQDAGDLELLEDASLRWKGSENYQQVLSRIMRP